MGVFWNSKAPLRSPYLDELRRHASLFGFHAPYARIQRMFCGLQISGLSAACVQLSSREATQEELLRVHSQEHIDQVGFDGEGPKG